MHGTHTRQIYRVEHKSRIIAVWQTLCGGAASAALLELMIAKGAKKFVSSVLAGHLIKMFRPAISLRSEGTATA